jgi:hypothetical protein
LRFFLLSLVTAMAFSVKRSAKISRILGFTKPIGKIYQLVLARLIGTIVLLPGCCAPNVRCVP